MITLERLWILTPWYQRPFLRREVEFRDEGTPGHIKCSFRLKANWLGRLIGFGRSP